jgi:hypothetical protein
VTGTFKANNPYNNFLLFVYALLLKFPLFLHPVIPAPQPSDGILYKVIPFMDDQPFYYISRGFQFLSLLHYCFIQAIAFNKFVNDQRMMAKPNYLTGMKLFIDYSLFSEWFVTFSSLDYKHIS